MIDLLIILSVIVLLSAALWLRHFTRFKEMGLPLRMDLHPSVEPLLKPRLHHARELKPPLSRLESVDAYQALDMDVEDSGEPVCLHSLIFFFLKSIYVPLYLRFSSFRRKISRLLSKRKEKRRRPFKRPYLLAGNLTGGRLVGYTDAMEPRDRVGYTGQMKIPTRVYEGDSRNISITLVRYLVSKQPEITAKITDTKSGKSIELQFPKGADAAEFLEIELLSAALTVAGEKKQQQRLSSEALNFCWNCHFGKSGNQVVSFIIRLVSALDQIQLGSVEHQIKVVKLDHLTQRQVWLLSRVAAILTGLVALAGALHRLGVW